MKLNDESWSWRLRNWLSEVFYFDGGPAFTIVWVSVFSISWATGEFPEDLSIVA